MFYNTRAEKGFAAPGKGELTPHADDTLPGNRGSPAPAGVAGPGSSSSSLLLGLGCTTRRSCCEPETPLHAPKKPTPTPEPIAEPLGELAPGSHGSGGCKEGGKGEESGQNAGIWGGLGSCPRCCHPFRLPPEHDASCRSTTHPQRVALLGASLRRAKGRNNRSTGAM